MSQELVLRAPNDEQLLAIEHSGGALLSAGAGSGKTFVLVEHIYYLFKTSYDKYRGVSSEEVIIKIKKDFSKIVIMTFTNKAAGELSLRLQKRFQQAYERSKNENEDIPEDVLAKVNEVLEQMYVGTIHGFCYSLLLSGAVGFDGNDIEIISDFEIKEKIKKVFNLWLTHCSQNEDPQAIDHILVNKKNFVEAMGTIFADPDLRLKWLKGDSELELNCEKACNDLLDFYFEDWRSAFKVTSSDVDNDDKKTPKWVEFIYGFEKEVKFDSSINFLFSFNSFLKSFGRLPSVKIEKAGEKLFNFFQSVKEFKAFDKKYFEDISVCVDKKEELNVWHGLISRIFGYINQEYLRYPGVSFSDLEYSVYSALKNNNVTDDLFDRFSYFIIDEFQDTSEVQFEIVNMITKGDMKKVFSVGDVKQAIYGFRGGELGVFKEAEKKTYKNLTLKNNYRSEKKVIDFNNSFFSFLLPRGDNFEGEDTKFSVDMTEQKIPSGKDAGDVKKYSVKCEIEGLPDDVKSLSSAEISYLESMQLIKLIKKHNDDNKCVLYTKLGPSHFLLKELIKQEIPFRFQVKVAFQEDPLISLFSVLSSYHALKGQDKDFKDQAFLLTNEILEIVLGPTSKNVDYKNAFIKSEMNNSSLGVMDTFIRFLWDLGVSSSNTNESWGLIRTLCIVGENNFNKLHEFIGVFTQGKYSLDFHYGNGKDPCLLTVMTVHASKGLEFDTVLLGGIHTNGDSKSSLNFFGKDEGSYKWYPSSSNKKAIKTPQYILEYERNRKKDFSENKRLFYVALTRAVERILWCDLKLNEKDLFYSKNSWVNALRRWELASSDSELIDIVDVSLTFSYEKLKLMRLDLKPAILHYSNLGMGLKNASQTQTHLGLFAELSVTRFTTLGDCPRKFYLSNYLKISPEDLGLEEYNPYTGGESSADRGTAVHESLSRAIVSNLAFSLADQDHFKNDKKALDGINWAIEELKIYRDKQYNFESEEAVKFSLFGQMISGTPDLIIHDNAKQDFEVWDFKTGQYSDEKSRPYWLQLKLYAYALMKDNPAYTSGNKSLSLKLVFTDEKNIKEELVTFDQVKTQLYMLWLKLEQLDQVNLEHCDQCSYRQICRPSS